MKVSSEATILIGVSAVALVVVYLVVKKTGQAVLNVNAGTPYAGAGAVGTLGNATNSILGGAPQSFGEWLSGKVADITMPYDPNAGAAPNTGDAGW